MKKYGAENLPAYAPIKEALKLPSGAPDRLTPDRRTRILNYARVQAAYQPTFADRLARWFDYGFFPKTSTRYAVMRALVPVVITIFIVLGIESMLLPAVAPARERGRRVQAANDARMREITVTTIEPEHLEEPTKDLQKLDELRRDLRAVPPPVLEDRSYKSPRSYSVAGGVAADAPAEAPAAEGTRRKARDSVKEGELLLGYTANAEEKADKDLPSDRSDLTDQSDSGDLLTPSPVVFKGLWSGREKAGRDEGLSRGGGALRAAAPDKKTARPALNGPASAAKPAPTSEPPASSTFQPAGFNPFVETAKNPFSTFSIDVDTASYTLTRNFLMQNRLPPPDAVRTEEIVNYFDYHYPAPATAPFAIHSECAPAPFGPGLQLLRIGVKARHLGREENRPALLLFLIDTSGSMSTPDRIDLVKQSLRLLVNKLAPADRVAIVQYDSHARLVLDYTPASDMARILQAIDALQTSGSTNLEEGMRLAYELARRAFQPGAANRVLLFSDGAANLGSASAEEILAVVADSRRQGLFCSVYGVGRGGYNDVMLETLANKGDGVYTFLDSLDEAKRVFVDDLAATLNTVASDVKIQVEFNPARVPMWRQLGYENRKLNKEDFRNDAVDAGEVGSGQSVTALYELTLAPNSKGPLGTVRVRCRDLRAGHVVESETPLSETMLRARWTDAGAPFKLAACAAELAEILRSSPFAADSDPAELTARLRPVALDYSLDPRVQELLRLVEKTAGIKRESN